MYAVGVCLKRGGWIFSVYKRIGEAYPTLKVRRVEGVRLEVLKPDLKTLMEEVVENVRRLGKA